MKSSGLFLNSFQLWNTEVIVVIIKYMNMLSRVRTFKYNMVMFINIYIYILLSGDANVSFCREHQINLICHHVFSWPWKRRSDDVSVHGSLHIVNIRQICITYWLPTDSWTTDSVCQRRSQSGRDTTCKRGIDKTDAVAIVGVYV